MKLKAFDFNGRRVYFSNGCLWFYSGVRKRFYIANQKAAVLRGWWSGCSGTFQRDGFTYAAGADDDPSYGKFVVRVQKVKGLEELFGSEAAVFRVAPEWRVGWLGPRKRSVARYQGLPDGADERPELLGESMKALFECEKEMSYSCTA